MSSVSKLSLLLLAAALPFGFVPPATAEDWTGWMGPDRQGVYRPGSDTTADDVSVSPQTEILWRHPIGGGYAGPAVAGDRVLVFDYQIQSGTIANNPGRRVNLDGRERVIALDRQTGDEVWTHAYDCPYSISYPAGPRCTPTIDGNRVYTLGSEGDLRCLDLADGALQWSVNLKNDFLAEVPIWGFSAHPLVHDDMVITMVGGPGQGVVAFDKNSGDVKWKSLDARAGYCPPSIVTAGGTDQLIVYHPTAVESLNPDDGSVYWTIPVEPMYDMSINRPVVDGNKMFVSGIRSVALMIQLDDAKPAAKELWYGDPKSAVHGANSTPMFARGVIYGTDCNEGCLIAVDAADGSRLWKTFSATQPGETRRVNHGTAFLTRIGDSDRYLIMAENGDLVVAKLTRDGYQELGRKHILSPTGEAFGRDVVWSHPAYADGVAYARNDKEIVAVAIE